MMLLHAFFEMIAILSKVESYKLMALPHFDKMKAIKARLELITIAALECSFNDSEVFINGKNTNLYW